MTRLKTIGEILKPVKISPLVEMTKDFSSRRNDKIKNDRRNLVLVPTLRVGMPASTLRVEYYFKAGNGPI
jgi:hypothetical protein